jgi:hypothetical protein
MYQYLSTLCGFLRKHQQALQSSSADYAAMLSTMGAARSRYGRLITQQTAAAGDGAAPVAAAAAVIAAGSPSAAGSLQPASSWELTGFGLRPKITETAASPATAHQAGAAATPVLLQAGAPNSLTVEGLSAAGKFLPRALSKWVVACGMGDLAGVLVVELLPHYSKLLCMLDDLHSSRKLSAHTVYNYLSVLCSFLKDHQRALQSSSVDYAAMLNSMDAARSRYRRLSLQQTRDAKNAAAISAAGAAAGSADGLAPVAQLRPHLSGDTEAQAAEAAGLEAVAAAVADDAAGGDAAPLAVAAAMAKAAAGAAASESAGPAATQVQTGVFHSYPVCGVSAAGTHLRCALRKWAQACGFTGNTSNVSMAALLPNYASLLSFFDSQHSSKLLTSVTIYRHLQSLCFFLREHQQLLQDSSSFDYAAMLSSLIAARRKYYQLKQQPGEPAAAAAAAAAAGAGGCGSAAPGIASVPTVAAQLR